MTATAQPPRLLTRDEQAAALADSEGMVWYLARKFGKPHGIAGDRLDDLAAEIRVGFVLAATRFQPDKGFKFITYATWYGKDWAFKWLNREVCGGLHVPIHHGYQPRVMVSMDADRDGQRNNYSTNGDSDPVASMFADHRDPEPPAFEADEWWTSALSGLKERARRFVLMKFREGLTLRQMAAREGLSKERVRQIVTRAVERIRESRPDLDPDWPWSAGRHRRPIPKARARQ